MPMYAHAVIELEDRTIQRGDEVSPNDFDSETYDALYEAGSIGDAEYDAENDKVPTPDVVEIDGVKYVKDSNA